MIGQRSVVASLLVLSGCGPSPDATLARKSAIPAIDPCRDRIEARAIACSNHAARRGGETLYVRLDGGRDTTFVDDTSGEAPGGFHYAGRLGRASFHLIEVWGHEAPPSFIILNGRTGRGVVAQDEPIVSPNAERFATAADDWNNCTERDHPSLDIWRITDTLPVLEWRLDPWSCAATHETGWGPTDPRWRGPDTLEFTRNDVQIRDTATTAEQRVAYQTRPMVAARGRDGWHVVATP